MNRRKLKKIEYWEGDSPPPTLSKASQAFSEMVIRRYKEGMLDDILKAPYLSKAEIESMQFKRIRQLVQIAYEKVPIYREKYKAVGFSPQDLNTWEDYYQLPCITKDELIEAWPNGCINTDYETENLFYTRSSGSSGKTLRIAVDQEAILKDTFQGIRQFWLQTGGRYLPEDVVAHIYTVPWWVDSIGGDYQTVFISSLIHPGEIAKILDGILPDIISLYPSNLEAVLPYLTDRTKKSLKLVVVHSEMSAKSQRQKWSYEIGAPVLDEYSSEELTRIALELPCGHYHLCEDTVRVDVLDASLRPISSGVGIVCGTNLLNTAMPFIKYIQGDLVHLEESDKECDIGWRQIGAIEGRENDSFITESGEVVPAGTILDITYRWMFDTGVNIREFEIVQKSPKTILVRMYAPDLSPRQIWLVKHQLDNLLQSVLPGVHVSFIQSPDPLRSETIKKWRPIRREFDA